MAYIRQRELFDQFDFLCQCEACNNPEKFSIKYKADEGDDWLQVHGQSELIEEFKKNCQFITDNIARYPSYELINAMYKNRKILQFLADDQVKQ